MRVTTSSCSVVTSFTTYEVNEGGFRSQYTAMCSAIATTVKKRGRCKTAAQCLEFLASELATTASKCVG